MTCIEMVKDFCKLNGAVIDGVDNGPEVAVLRIRLMLEELAETVAALHENNVVEAADGLCDLLYVIYGAAVSYGIPLEDGFLEPLCKPVAEFDRWSVLAFTYTSSPQLHAVCTELPYDANGYIALEALARLVRTVCEAGAGWGFPMRELFAEVHRSNLTKTFAKNTTGGKYGAVKPKGPGYTPPDISGILEACIRA